MAKIVERVWKFLGMAPRRTEEKTVQKVKHWQEVNKDGKLHKQVNFPLYAQVKKDGVFATVVVIHGTARIYNRTGRKMVNVEHIEFAMTMADFPDGVYLGELCCASCSLEVLSGIVNPNRVEAIDQWQSEHLPNFEVNFHDYLTLFEFQEGVSHIGYVDRWHNLEANLKSVGWDSPLPYYTMVNQDEVEAFALECISNGEEGAVFKCNVGWEAGHKGWRMMKWVREIDYDLLCVGWEEGTGKYLNKVANLIFKWHTGTIKAMLGKGWSHKDAADLFTAVQLPFPNDEHPDFPIGKVYRVKGLQGSSKGKIRLPKVGERRDDKTEGDF